MRQPPSLSPRRMTRQQAKMMEQHASKIPQKVHQKDIKSKQCLKKKSKLVSIPQNCVAKKYTFMSSTDLQH